MFCYKTWHKLSPGSTKVYTVNWGREPLKPIHHYIYIVSTLIKTCSKKVRPRFINMYPYLKCPPMWNMPVLFVFGIWQLTVVSAKAVNKLLRLQRCSWPCKVQLLLKWQSHSLTPLSELSCVSISLFKLDANAYMELYILRRDGYLTQNNIQQFIVTDCNYFKMWLLF